MAGSDWILSGIGYPLLWKIFYKTREDVSLSVFVQKGIVNRWNNLILLNHDAFYVLGG